MLMARLVSGGTAIRAGSLRACASGRIVTPLLPPNVSTCVVPGTSVAPGPATATSTWPTRSGAAPKLLLIVTRAALPPTLVKTMSRTVWLRKPAADMSPGTRPAGVAGDGLAPQLATQCMPRPWLWWVAAEAVTAPLAVMVTARTVIPVAHPIQNRLRRRNTHSWVPVMPRLAPRHRVRASRSISVGVVMGFPLAGVVGEDVDAGVAF